MAPSECDVCYAAVANCKLVCNHRFCTSCVKQWYLKGAEPTCPMCRRALYFKGLYKKREEWAEEAYQSKTDEVFGEALDACIEEGLANSEAWLSIVPKRHKEAFRRDAMEEIMEEITDVEKTHRFLKSEEVHEEDIRDVHYYQDYYSDRKVGSKNQHRENPAWTFQSKKQERQRVQRQRAPRGRERR